ncbi:MAG TPA: transporter, partial [Methylomirabilota bacterium]|nr:transporter [Methylomirabilota bacterium]
QITGSPPYVIGNFTFKTETGTGPFDIKRDAFGVEQDLATGSGFYSAEPNVTVIYPSDPAVLFANVGYEWNIGQSVGKNIGGEIVDSFDPGDGIDATVGMGFSVNDRLTFDLGYKHSFLMATQTKVTDPTNNTTRIDKSESLTLGSLLFGLGYRVSDNINLNLDFEFGVTADAPDMTATLRVPIAFSLF